MIQKIDYKILKILEKAKEDNNISINMLDDIKGFILGNGKKIRPRIFLNTLKSNAIELDDIYYELAAAIELLHQAAVIHDDIIDDDILRRGNPSLYVSLSRKYGMDGKKAALVIGDALIFISLLTFDQNLKKINRQDLMSFIYKNAIYTARGEFEELILNKVDHKYMKELYDLKTAFYSFFFPVLLARYISGDKNIRTEFKKKLLEIGEVYQLKNDLIDILGDSKYKGRNSDIKHNKKTMLFFLIYNELEEKERKRLDDIFDRKDIDSYCHFMREKKAKEKVNEKIKSLFSKDFQNLIYISQIAFPYQNKQMKTAQEQ